MRKFKFGGQSHSRDTAAIRGAPEFALSTLAIPSDAVTHALEGG